MREAAVYVNQRKAGTISRNGSTFTFTYEKAYRQDPKSLPVSLSFPKNQPSFTSETLFPFFCGLLAEGENKGAQCAVLKIDEDDAFTRLTLTAGSETIGAVTVRQE